MKSFLDEAIGPPGSPDRVAFEKEVARLGRKDRRLDRIFGWMKHIPPHMPAEYDEGWQTNYWHGLGPLMFMFWHTLADEKSFMGVLDMMSFHYFDDRYVLSFSDIRKLRRDARKWRRMQEVSSAPCACSMCARLRGEE